MLRSLWLILFLILSACGGGDGSAPVPAGGTSHCGVITGRGRISGTVTSVHDGDTVTVAGQAIRLDSIDAPELDQAYGSASRDHLAALVLGQHVTVTYAKTDLYGRVVGTVFKSDCMQVNLNQVASGAAWYYEAYKCEIGIAQRHAYAAPGRAHGACGRRRPWPPGCFATARTPKYRFPVPTVTRLRFDVNPWGQAADAFMKVIFPRILEKNLTVGPRLLKISDSPFIYSPAP